MQYSRISADCHIDMPWIPNDLFTANASAALRERMPFVVDGRTVPMTCKNGTSFGLVGGGGPGRPEAVRQNYRVDKMAAVGLYETARRHSAPTDPHLRIKDMELDGVQRVISASSRATRLNDMSAKEMFRIYNDWLKTSAGTIPRDRPGLPALRTSTRCARGSARAKRLKGLDFLLVGMVPCASRVEPLWQAVTK